MQGIANPRSNLAQSHYSNFFTIKKESLGNCLYDLVFYESGRQDSNLRPCAPNALDLSNEIYQYFLTITRL